MDDLLLKGLLIDPAAGWEGPAQIYIRRGEVVAVDFSLPGVPAPVLDFGSCMIMPGLVDMHVHLREPGGEAKETIASGCAAAVAGGFTALACMPNTYPPVDNGESIAMIKKRAKEVSLARVYPIGAITAGLKGLNLAPLAEMAAAGAAGFSDDGYPVMDSKVMLEALQRAEELGLPLISHCEDLTLSAGGVIGAGETARRLGLPPIPPSAEAIMVARDILLLPEAGVGILHLAHLSTRQSVQLLRWAREQGFDVTAEVTPHHLLLTSEAVETRGSDAKMKPPLFAEEDRKALLQALKEDFISIIATDHAPHQPEEKKAGLLSSPFGVTGLETALPLLWTELVEKNILTPGELVLRFSTAPAQRLGVKGGTLAPGSPADLVVLDPVTEGTIDKNTHYSKSKNTPFHGTRAKGFPLLTMVGGEIKMWKGKVKGFGDILPELTF